MPPPTAAKKKQRTKADTPTCDARDASKVPILSGIVFACDAFDPDVASTDQTAAAAAAATTKQKKSSVKREACTNSTTDSTKPPPVLRLDQLSTSAFVDNVPCLRLASSVPDAQKVARVLEARDYRGIHLFADPATGCVYDPDDIMAKVIDPRVISPRKVARLGPWTPSTGIGNGNAAAGGDDDDEDEFY